ncbi:MAG: PAS domain-containing protein [Janthinobacterium lividum]
MSPSVFAALPMASLLLTPEWRIEAVSDAFLAATFTTREQLEGQLLFKVFAGQPATPEASTMANLRASLQQVLATGQAHHMPVQRYSVPDPTAPGTRAERYWQPINTPVLNADQQVTGCVHTIVDVTAQVQLKNKPPENQARAQDEQAETAREHYLLRALLTEAPVALAFFDAQEQRILSANTRMCAIWGRTLPELLGRPLLVALPELRGQGFEELIRQALDSQTAVVGTEVPATMTRNGHLQTTYYNFVFQPFHDEEGVVRGVIQVASEVTEQVLARQRVEVQEQNTNQLNEELAASNEELHASNEELSASNNALFEVQHALHQLNEGLEVRIAERTRALQQAQAEAESQRQRLARLVQQAPAAICILNGPDLVFEFVNPGYQQLYPGRQLLDKPFSQALPELADHPTHQTLRAVYETGVTHQESAVLIRLPRAEDGRLVNRYFNHMQQARYDEQGRIDGVLVFAFEITAQVLAQQAHEASTWQLQLLTDSVPVLIGYLDQKQKYRFANKAYEAWFGYEATSLIGRTLQSVVGELAYQRIQGYVERALAGERVDFETEMPYSPTKIKYIRGSYVPDVRGGQVVGLYGLIDDITELVVAHHQVQDLNEKLAATNEELHVSNEELMTTNRQLMRTNVDLDTFIYTASHDLKAPITNIEGLLTALRDYLPAKVQRQELVSRVLLMMQGAVERFQLTIAQLTDVSRLQQAQNQPTEHVNLAATVEAVRLDLLSLIEATGTQLTIDVGEQFYLMFAPQHLRSVIYNLLSNAIKYRHPERIPQVLLRASRIQDTVVLTVQDNGLGIDAAHQSRLFGLFQRLHSHVEGSGVGLFMVKRLVENAGGTISVHSELGVGSIFTVTLRA